MYKHNGNFRLPPVRNNDFFFTDYFQEHLIKDNLALNFLLEVFITYKQERGLANLVSTLKKGGLEGRLMEFVPSNKRTEEHFRTIFEEKGLSELVKLHKNQANQEAKRDLQQQLDEALAEGRPNKEIITDIRDSAAKYCIPEQDVIAIVSTGGIQKVHASDLFDSGPRMHFQPF